MAFYAAALQEALIPGKFQEIMDDYAVRNDLPVISHPTPSKEFLKAIMSRSAGPSKPVSPPQDSTPETHPNNIALGTPISPSPSAPLEEVTRDSSSPPDALLAPTAPPKEHPVLSIPSPADSLAAPSDIDTALAAAIENDQETLEVPWETVSRSTRSRKGKYSSTDETDVEYVCNLLRVTNTLPIMVSMGPSRDPRLVNNTEKLFKAFHRRNPNVQIKELARMLSEGSIRVSPSPFECKDGTYADHEMLSADIIQEVNKNPRTRERFVHFIPESVVKERLEYDVIRLRK